MRKLAFVNETEFKKIMVYETENEEVYVFYYDTWIDDSSKRDDVYPTLAEAESLCLQEHRIQSSDWIEVDDPIEGCQHDFIAPTRVKGRNLGKQDYQKLEMLCNGRWHDVFPVDIDIQGTTVNERLFVSGLMDEFDNSKFKKDSSKARKILTSLQLDEKSVNAIIEKEFGHLN